ncbi:hypothetical protein C8Q70DRAFT_924688, partial [Cubamyces menziesii]
DSAVKQILLALNEKESFIIEDLDDHHVVIKADEEYRVRRELEAEVRSEPIGVGMRSADSASSLRRIPIVLSRLAE